MKTSYLIFQYEKLRICNRKIVKQCTHHITTLKNGKGHFHALRPFYFNRKAHPAHKPPSPRNIIQYTDIPYPRKG